MHRASAPRGWSRAYLGGGSANVCDHGHGRREARTYAFVKAWELRHKSWPPTEALAAVIDVARGHGMAGRGGRGGVDGEGRGHAWPLATSTGPRRAAPHHPCGLVAGGLPAAGLRHACYTRPYASSACVLPQHSPLPRTVLAHNKNGHAKQPFPMTPGPSDQWAPCKAPTDQWAPLQGARRPGCPARRPLAQSQG